MNEQVSRSCGYLWICAPDLPLWHENVTKVHLPLQIYIKSMCTHIHIYISMYVYPIKPITSSRRHQYTHLCTSKPGFLKTSVLTSFSPLCQACSALTDLRALCAGVSANWFPGQNTSLILLNIKIAFQRGCKASFKTTFQLIIPTLVFKIFPQTVANTSHDYKSCIYLFIAFNLNLEWSWLILIQMRSPPLNNNTVWTPKLKQNILWLQPCSKPAGEEGWGGGGRIHNPCDTHMSSSLSPGTHNDSRWIFSNPG